MIRVGALPCNRNEHADLTLLRLCLVQRRVKVVADRNQQVDDDWTVVTRWSVNVHSVTDEVSRRIARTHTGSDREGRTDGQTDGHMPTRCRGRRCDCAQTVRRPTHNDTIPRSSTNPTASTCCLHQQRMKTANDGQHCIHQLSPLTKIVPMRLRHARCLFALPQCHFFTFYL